MTVDEYIDLYAEICDVVERNYQGIPLDEPQQYGHTSDEARAAANKIFKLCGIIKPDGFDEYMESHLQKILAYQNTFTPEPGVRCPGVDGADCVLERGHWGLHDNG